MKEGFKENVSKVGVTGICGSGILKRWQRCA